MKVNVFVTREKRIVRRISKIGNPGWNVDLRSSDQNPC